MAYNVYVEDKLPLQYVGSEPYGVSEQNNNVTWNIPSMAINEQKTLIIHYVVPSTYKEGTQLFNNFSCIFSNSKFSYVEQENISNSVDIELNVPVINSYFESSIIDTSTQVWVTYSEVEGITVFVGQTLK